MRNCAYRILEYAKSDLEPEGSLFAAIMQFQDVAVNSIKGCVLADWKSLLERGSELEISYIEDFLFDLRQQNRKQNTSAYLFFESIDDLSTGPIRTTMSGVCQIRDLVSIHPSLSDERDVILCSEEALNCLVQEIVLTNAPLSLIGNYKSV